MQHRRRWVNRASTQRRGDNSSSDPGRRRCPAAEDVHQRIFVLCYMVTGVGPGHLHCGRMSHRARRYLYPFAISGPVQQDRRMHSVDMDVEGRNRIVWPSTGSSDAPAACADFVFFPLSATVAVVVAHTCSWCCTLSRCRSAVLWPIHRLRAPPRRSLISAVQ
ncbi:Piso0_000161 [Millerozyma farinosa CBS 7064]|uniref:Piso0_000161 protein n=1 Tax=Pichia sorbitophila (strain ATCC MYA-4447 / BCRC 22081 / CBS 7064 / NBRC 10061 / NRRL Y-12695) TaxID=559304 RepID=G8YUP3_PICSO|nr:Piso0_000161 [Millerozyma farinosa CBS 7064]